MRSIILAATMTLGTAVAVLGENDRYHMASTQPGSKASIPRVNEVALPQVAMSIEGDDVKSASHTVMGSYSPDVETIKRNDAQGNVLIEDSFVPEFGTHKHLQAQATPVKNQSKDAVQVNHLISVPQMQSTMAPVEAAQTFRSFQSARASVSAMSKLAAQKGPAAATMAVAAASASASLAESRPGLEKSLMQSCKGDTECKKFYKNGLKSDAAADKGQEVDYVHQGRGAGTAVTVSMVMVAFSGLVALFLLM